MQTITTYSHGRPLIMHLLGAAAEFCEPLRYTLLALRISLAGEGKSMASIFITGTSKGIGLEAALAFARKGHKVYATMRDPARDTDLARRATHEKLPITISAMDVDSDESVKSCF